MVKWSRPGLLCRRPGFESQCEHSFCKRVRRGVRSTTRHRDYGAKLGGRERGLLQQINKIKVYYMYICFCVAILAFARFYDWDLSEKNFRNFAISQNPDHNNSQWVSRD